MANRRSASKASKVLYILIAANGIWQTYRIFDRYGQAGFWRFGRGFIGVIAIGLAVLVVANMAKLRISDSWIALRFPWKRIHVPLSTVRRAVSVRTQYKLNGSPILDDVVLLLGTSDQSLLRISKGRFGEHAMDEVLASLRAANIPIETIPSSQVVTVNDANLRYPGSYSWMLRNATKALWLWAFGVMLVMGMVLVVVIVANIAF